MKLQLPIFLVSCLCFFSFGKSTVNCRYKLDFENSKIVQKVNFDWLEMDLKLTKNCVGFSAPVAARSLNYVSIGMYEVAILQPKSPKSLSDKLVDFHRITWGENENSIDLTLASNEINHLLTLHFYANMPVESRKEVELLYTESKKKLSIGKKGKIIKNSQAYAKLLANEIIEWAEKDGGSKAYSRNFPTSFEPAVCDSCWEKTPLPFQAALLPYWGENRKNVLNSGETVKDIVYIPFSTDPKSEFYRQNDTINNFYKTISKQQQIIAEYWDDTPGYSGSPVGHLFQIALDLSKSQNIDLETSNRLFALLGIAINDAVIVTWKLKYTYNLIRPITYIQNHINGYFNPILNTPPFPEFPSGHSFQAGAGVAVLIDIFSDSLAFSDFTNAKRTDIKGTARNYKNLSQMANEMSISRFYGGIHYLNTLNESLKHGRLIGENLLQSIQIK